MYKYIAALLTFALFAGEDLGYGQDAPAPIVPSSGKKKAPPYVDIHIVPVGPVSLARFGRVTEKPGKDKKETPADETPPSEGEGEDSEKKAPVPSGPKGFVVLQKDAREYPPKALYLKQGDKFAVIPCSQNSIGTSIRVPVTQAEMVFYERNQGEDGVVRYKKYFTHTWNSSQKRLLFTITKPLKSKFWTKPITNAYDLSPARLRGKSVSLVNAGKERMLGLMVEGHPKVVKPYERTSLGVPAEQDGIEITFGALDGNRKLHAPMKLSLPNRPEEHLLILAFPCTSQESFRGVKSIRGRIIKGQYRPVTMRKQEKQG